jgi:hypothetical protein
MKKILSALCALAFASTVYANPIDGVYYVLRIHVQNIGTLPADVGISGSVYSGQNSVATSVASVPGLGAGSVATVNLHCWSYGAPNGATVSCVPAISTDGSKSDQWQVIGSEMGPWGGPAYIIEMPTIPVGTRGCTNIVLQVNNPSSDSVYAGSISHNGAVIEAFPFILPGQIFTRTFSICQDENFAWPNESYSSESHSIASLYTNITGHVFNDTLDKYVEAYWSQNGTVQHTVGLFPGQSADYTMPISLAGNNDLKWGYTIRGQANDPWNPLDDVTKTNFIGGYTNNGTGSAGGGYGGAGGYGGGSGLIPPPPFTNNIPYPDGGTNSGSWALDSSVRAGFGTLHNDNQTLQTSLSDLNQTIKQAGASGSSSNDFASMSKGILDLNTKAAVITNQNGQLVSIVSVLTNDVWQVVSAITNARPSVNVSNQLVLPTNGLVVTVSNLQSEPYPTNIWVQNFPTNIGGNFTVTNFGQVLTNYAQETTLQGVSNLLSGTNFGGIAAGLSLLDSKLTVLTNQNGVIEAWFQTNSDAIPRLIAAMTNNVNPTNRIEFPTNLTVTMSQTNEPYPTNVWVQNFPTNIWVQNFPTNEPYPTNIWVQNFPTNQALTNYAQETTLQGISNQLAQLTATNLPCTPQEMAQQGATAAASGSNTLAGLAVESNPLTADMPMGSGPDNWVVAVPYLGVGSIDLNPMHLAWVAALAAFMRSAIKWVCFVSMLGVNSASLLQALNNLGAARQTESPVRLPLVGVATALVSAGIITSAMLAVPLFAAVKFIGYLSVMATNPFAGASGILAVSVWLADQFFPLAVIVSCAVAIYTFRILLSSIVWGVQTIIRFVVAG